MKKPARLNERELWNQKYIEGSHTLLEPDPFLLSAYTEFVGPLHPQPGTALDVAGGIGRHALWLARAGWRITVADVSDVALAQAMQSAKQRNASIDTLRADLSTPAGRKILASRQFDLVLVFFYLERKLFPAVMKALKPGGILIYKTYTVEQRRFPGGPKHPLHLLKPNELLRAFRGLRVLHYCETVRDKGVAEFVGWKQR
jgi:2-polyprenyl-3-methyl-5-hydroxy-6-metoxy-1,4-benzoquinol methylase